MRVLGYGSQHPSFSLLGLSSGRISLLLVNSVRRRQVCGMHSLCSAHSANEFE